MAIYSIKRRTTRSARRGNGCSDRDAQTGVRYSAQVSALDRPWRARSSLGRASGTPGGASALLPDAVDQTSRSDGGPIGDDLPCNDVRALGNGGLNRRLKRRRQPLGGQLATG